MGPHVRQPQTVYYHMGEPLEQIAMTPTTSRKDSDNPGIPDPAPADAAAGTERSWLRSGDLALCGAPSVDWSDTEYGISEAQIRKVSVDRACKESDTFADIFGCSFGRKKPKQVVPRRDRYEHSARIASVQSNATWCGEDDTGDLNWCPVSEMDEEIVEPRARGWTLPGWNSNLEKRTTRPGAPIPADSPFALCPDDSELAEEYITDYEHQRCRAW